MHLQLIYFDFRLWTSDFGLKNYATRNLSRLV